MCFSRRRNGQHLTRCAYSLLKISFPILTWIHFPLLKCALYHLRKICDICHVWIEKWQLYSTFFLFVLLTKRTLINVMKIYCKSFISIVAHIFGRKATKKLLHVFLMFLCFTNGCRTATFCEFDTTIPVFTKMNVLWRESCLRMIEHCTNYFTPVWRC